MKKNYLITALGIVVASLFYSCSTELETENQSASNLKESLSKSASKRPCEYFKSAIESTIIPGVKAIYLDNGISTTCDNNILIFPTLEDYENSILKLDKLIESHNNNFDQQTTGMTDLEADEYAESTGFDEDQSLTEFEKKLNFCSLRQHIVSLEDAWLDQQGDGTWNLDTSPDEYYIDDETERALLSLGSEFIVGGCEIGYTLYKRYDWGYVSFPIDDIGATSTILTQLNDITNPTHQPFNIGGATLGQVSDVLLPLKLKKYTITTTNPPTSQASQCHGEVKDKGEHLFSPARKIRWKHKLKDAHFPNTSGTTLMKTYTKSYRKKKKGWKKFKATIFTGFQGKIAVPIQCTDLGTQPLTGKEKRRKKVKERIYMVGDISVKQNAFFSIHKQEGNSYKNEVY